jgi:hypothetical protein
MSYIKVFLTNILRFRTLWPHLLHSSPDFRTPFQSRRSVPCRRSCEAFRSPLTDSKT